MKTRTIVSLALLAGLLCSGCSTSRHNLRLVEVSPGIIRGSKPRSQSDFDALHANGIRTILSLEMMPWDVGPERRHAQRRHFRYFDVPILASVFEPSEARVKEALLLLHDRSLRPIFVHCFLGEDRDVFLIGLYRIYFQDWTPQAAWAEMLRSHFHDTLRLRGLTAYFWHHTRPPEWVKALRNEEREHPPQSKTR